MNASIQLGLQLGVHGKEFIGSYQIKGCYAIDGVAFFGSGGLEKEHQTSLVKPLLRPNGYDCSKII